VSSREVGCCYFSEKEEKGIRKRKGDNSDEGDFKARRRTIKRVFRVKNWVYARNHNNNDNDNNNDVRARREILPIPREKIRENNRKLTRRRIDQRLPQQPPPKQQHPQRQPRINANSSKPTPTAQNQHHILFPSRAIEARIALPPGPQTSLNPPGFEKFRLNEAELDLI